MSFSQRLDIRASREPWLFDAVTLRLLQRTVTDGQVSTAAALPLVFKTRTPEECGTVIEPTMVFKPDEAQQLMDELWLAGVRPTEGQGSVGQLAAVHAHLEDLRRLVFKDKKTKP